MFSWPYGHLSGSLVAILKLKILKIRVSTYIKSKTLSLFSVLFVVIDLLVSHKLVVKLINCHVIIAVNINIDIIIIIRCRV